MNTTVEGFCYHCQDCNFMTGFEKSCTLHSEKLGHSVFRRFRSACVIHNGRFEKKMENNLHRAVSIDDAWIACACGLHFDDLQTFAVHTGNFVAVGKTQRLMTNVRKKE